MVDIGVEESNPDFIEWQGTCQPSPSLPYKKKKKKKKKKKLRKETRKKEEEKAALRQGM